MDDYYDYILPSNLVLLLAYAVFFYVQYKLQINKSQMATTRFNGCCGLYLLGPFFQLLFCNFIKAKVDELSGISMAVTAVQMCFHTMFFA